MRWVSRLTFPTGESNGTAVPSLDGRHNKALEIKLARKPNFARHLRDARIKRRLSVAEVAEQVGVSGPCVYFWEAGRTRPRDANLSALCKALKLPIKATREMAAG